MTTKYRNVNQNDYASANTYLKTKLKPFLGIIISFLIEVTSCVLKPHENVHYGIYVMASDSSADCKYCTHFFK